MIKEMNPEFCWNIWTWDETFRQLKKKRLHDKRFDVLEKKRKEIDLFWYDDHYSALLHIQRIIKINHGVRCPRCFKDV